MRSFIYVTFALWSYAIRLCQSQTTSTPLSSSTTDISTITSSASVASITSGSMSTTTSSGVAEVITHTVNVAKNSNSYDPNSITAGIGDVIIFQFYPTNHTVIRAEYEYPCIPYEDTGENKVGFFSGFHPVDTILDNPPTWSLTVNSTNPVFFYCSAPNSCIGNGMVGVINPNSSQTLDVQIALAHNSSYMLLPGQAFPDEGSFSSSMTANLATKTSAAASATVTAASSSSSHKSLSSGAIAGIAVGGAVALLLLIALFYLMGRNKGLLAYIKNQPKYATSHAAPSPEMSTSYPVHAAQAGTYQYSPELQGHFDLNRFGAHSPPPGDAPPYHGYGDQRAPGTDEFGRAYPGAYPAGSPPSSPPPRFPSGVEGPNLQTSNLTPLGRQNAGTGPQSPQELGSTEIRPIDKKT